MTATGRPATCPSWCVTSLSDHADDDPGRLQHDGPEIAYGMQAVLQDGGEVMAYFSLREGEFTAVELRELAKECLQAADWLEAHR